MLDVVRNEIANSDDLDDAGRRRVEKCLPWLEGALYSWIEAAHPVGPDTLVLAAATPKAGLILRANDWPVLDHDATDKLDRFGGAAALVASIEGAGNSDADAVLTGLTMVLGLAGVNAQKQAAAQARATGRLPVTVLLVDNGDDNTTAFMATIVALQRVTLH